MAEVSNLSDFLRRELFIDEAAKVYAILDGASVPGLLEKLAEHRPENTCLISGTLDPDLAEAAPYLVHVDAMSPFAAWVLEKGWGNHWGIFAVVPEAVPFRDLRKHFRSLLRVRSPDGDPLLFRYYDPRVFRVYLPTCNVAELNTIFGPSRKFMLEGGQLGELSCFSISEQSLVQHTLTARDQ